MKTSSLILIPLVAVLSMSSSCDKDGKWKDIIKFEETHKDIKADATVINIKSEGSYNWLSIYEWDDQGNIVEGSRHDKEVLGLYDENDPESKKWGLKLDWIQAEYLNLYKDKWYGTGMKITVAPNNTSKQRRCGITVAAGDYWAHISIFQDVAPAAQGTSREE